MSLAPFVHAMGRGPGRARSLAQDEAQEAMRLMLSGEAEPEAVGALLMLMRYRGETAEEIAGFVEAGRETLGPWQDLHPDLDWPCYAAGRSRGLPWFLLSAKLVAASGRSVLLHGWTANEGAPSDPRTALAALGIPVVQSAEAAKAALGKGRIAFLPLEALSPPLLRLLKLREVLGLRSAVNTVMRCLNPALAAATVQGVFHPSYRALQQDAAARLGQKRLLAIKGGGGEFERHPSKAIEVFGLRAGRPFECVAEPVHGETRRLASGSERPGDLPALWASDAGDGFAKSVVLGTASLALMATGVADDDRAGQAVAGALWKTRLSAIAA